MGGDAKNRELKALVADDSRIARRVVGGLLERSCGFSEVLTAADGFEAVQAVKDTPKPGLDLVLLDWNMPNMSGIEALRAIRAMDRWMPIIMVTSEQERSRVVEAVAAGANDYIVKPFTVPGFSKKVNSAVARFSQQAYRRKTFKALIADDSLVARRVLRGVLQERCGLEHVHEVEDGSEALRAVAFEEFDIALLDWNMPGLSGLQVVRAIRSMGKDIPIIMVTSEKENSRILEAFDAGVDSYVVKPYEPGSLAVTLEQFMKLCG